MKPDASHVSVLIWVSVLGSEPVGFEVYMKAFGYRQGSEWSPISQSTSLSLHRSPHCAKRTSRSVSSVTSKSSALIKPFWLIWEAVLGSEIGSGFRSLSRAKGSFEWTGA